MPVSAGQAIGVITIEAQLTQAGQQIAQFSVTVEQQFSQVASSTNQVTNALTALAGAFGISFSAQAVAQATRMAMAMGEAAAQADVMRASYDQLAQGIGTNGDQMLAAMQSVSNGMVSNADLVSTANKAMLLSVTSNSTQMSQLLEIARARGQAMGLSVTQAFNDIVVGIGRMSPRILDNLGIMVGGEKAFSDYAESIGRSADSLTDLEKRQFLLNRTLSQSQALIEQTNKNVDNAYTSYSQLRTALDNAKKPAGDLINALVKPDITHATEQLKAYTEIVQQLAKAAEAASKFLTDLGRAAGTEISREAANAGLRGFTAPTTTPLSMGGPSATNFGLRAPPIPSFPLRPAGELQAAQDRFDKQQEIQKQADADALEENQNYLQRRDEMNASYDQQVIESAAAFAKQATRAQEDYENSILDIMRASQKAQTRLAEDHARDLERMQRDSSQRISRLNEDLDRTIGQQRADSADRIDGMAEDRDREIAQKQEDAAKRLLEIDEDFNRQREQAALSHQDNLSDAAARLDAFAVVSEQQRFAREQQAAQEDHDKKVSDEKDKLQESIDNLNESYDRKLKDEQESLQKSIDQAQAAHDRQVADEQAALAQRIADSNAAYAQQLADLKTANDDQITQLTAHYNQERTRRDDDQIDRLNQMATHHQQDLTKLDTEHNERLTQIHTHAEQERTAVDEEFVKQMKALGIHNDAWDAAQKAHDQKALLSAQIFQKEQERAQADSQKRMLEILALSPLLDPLAQAALTAGINSLDDTISGLDTSINQLQQQFDQLPDNPYVVTPSTTDQVSGSAIVTNSALPAQAQVSGSGNNTAVTIAAGAVVIYGAPGQSVEELGSMFDQRMYNVILRATGKR